MSAIVARMKHWSKRIGCAFWFHDFIIIAQVSDSSQHIACTTCRREFGINHDVRAILPWSTVAGLYLDRGYKPDRRAIAAAIAKGAE